MGKTEPKIKIYYNPNCSKSQCALETLQNIGADVELVNYLEVRPTVVELKALIAKLNCKPHDLVRTNEAVYFERFANKNLSDEDWIIAMHENPILIQRPIIVNGKTATIARSDDAIVNALKDQ